MRRTTRVVVVGGGLGGLAAAARLARAGMDVRVLEKEGTVGGRCSRRIEGGYTWDVGPTILLFPAVLREHFAACGGDATQSLELSACDPNYRLHFPDGETLTTSANLRAMKAELERVAPGSFDGYLSFIADARVQRDVAFGAFLSRSFDGPAAMFNVATLKGLVRSRAYRSLWNMVSERIQDERLRIALTFQTMYLGLSPLDGPAMFALLPYTEVTDGVWYARGGLGAISEALAELAERCGATIERGRPVRRIDVGSGRARGVETEDGERIEADVVLVNADLPYAYRALLGRPLRRRKYTSGALVLLFACDAPNEELLHHEMFFGQDYAGSFKAIFDERRVPHDPSFYVANPVRSDATVAPPGGSAVYALVPVPHLTPQGPDWRDGATVDRLREHVIARVEATVAPRFGASVRAVHAVTPLDWQARFSLENGAAFGLAHTLDQVAGMRPPNRDPETSNLYFVGASTQPATGIPNVLMGAKLVAERITKEQSG